ncbi:uncharacterized protein LOC143254929 [Tachypleus tridentatus]|uniref:uncharacterized protein LOC143254929 n=1 Tax=Tachypleus tridentatus TaxID=6853 RepID=UPI003FD1E333
MKRFRTSLFLTILATLIPTSSSKPPNHIARCEYEYVFKVELCLLVRSRYRTVKTFGAYPLKVDFLGALPVFPQIQISGIESLYPSKGKTLNLYRKPCEDATGKAGVCMFKWDCTIRNGVLLSTCTSGFLYLSCCKLPSKERIGVDKDQDAKPAPSPPPKSVLELSPDGSTKPLIPMITTPSLTTTEKDLHNGISFGVSFNMINIMKPKPTSTAQRLTNNSFPTRTSLISLSASDKTTDLTTSPTPESLFVKSSTIVDVTENMTVLTVNNSIVNRETDTSRIDKNLTKAMLNSNSTTSLHFTTPEFKTHAGYFSSTDVAENDINELVLDTTERLIDPTSTSFETYFNSNHVNKTITAAISTVPNENTTYLIITAPEVTPNLPILPLTHRNPISGTKVVFPQLEVNDISNEINTKPSSEHEFYQTMSTTFSSNIRVTTETSSNSLFFHPNDPVRSVKTTTEEVNVGKEPITEAISELETGNSVLENVFSGSNNTHSDYSPSLAALNLDDESTTYTITASVLDNSDSVSPTSNDEHITITSLYTTEDDNSQAIKITESSQVTSLSNSTLFNVLDATSTSVIASENGIDKVNNNLSVTSENLIGSTSISVLSGLEPSVLDSFTNNKNFSTTMTMVVSPLTTNVTDATSLLANVVTPTITENPLTVTKFITTANVPTPTRHKWDYKKDCGVRSLRPYGRIVGGRNAYFGEWPWQVLVKEATWLGLFLKNKCGGVLVNSKYVLTAGHCQPRFLASLLVVLGEHNFSEDNKSLKPVVKNVKRTIVHRNFNLQSFENDLALLELESPVQFQPHIAPICLPEIGENFTGRTAFVSGWGKLSEDGPVPRVLQYVKVPILSNSKCQQMFLDAGHVKEIRDDFLCAGYETGGKDSCEGDSGGPLMLQRDDGRWVLVGTVSHGIHCAEPNLPGVYMRTKAYKSWIESIINT